MLSTATESVSSFWHDVYNTDDSYWPFFLPLFTLWISSYVYSQYRGFDYSQWFLIHNIHNGGAMLLGSISIYYNNDAIFNERVGIWFSIGYFLIDLLDCVVRRDGIYGLHAFLCLSLGFSNATSPLCRMMRSNSKSTFLELSNPFMHLAKTTRQPLHFAMFAAVFTAVRMVWLPILLYQLRVAGMDWTDVRWAAVFVFYILNLYWYIKILGILYQGLFGGSGDKEEKLKVKKQV